MQTYDVMRLDINIFPLIRQTHTSSTSARFLNRKTIILASPLPLSPSPLHSRAHGTSWKSSTLSRPSHGPGCDEETTKRSSRLRSTNREDRVVPRTRRIASRPPHRRARNRFMPVGRSFRRGSHKDAFTERYAKTSQISHGEERAKPR